MKKYILLLLSAIAIVNIQAQNIGVTDAPALTPQSIMHIHKNAALGQVFQLTNTTSGADASSKGFIIDFDASFNAMFKNQYNGTNGGSAGFSFWTFTNGGSLSEKVNIQNDGTLRLLGSSSGYVGLKAAATAGSTTYTLPATAGVSGQVLATDGSGSLSWVTRTQGDGTGWLISGNAGTNGATNFIGTTDAQDFVVKTNNAGRAKITSAGVTTIGDGTNQTMIEADGTVVFQGNATVWDDLTVPGMSTKSTAANTPTEVVYQSSLLLWGFPNTGDKYVYFTVQMPHGWKVASDIKPHVHYVCPSSAASKIIVWKLTYTWANVNGTFDAPTTIQTSGTADADGDITANKHEISTFSSAISATGKSLSSMLICRLERHHDDVDITDTYTGSDALLLQIDFHYEKDTEGSHTDFTK